MNQQELYVAIRKCRDDGHEWYDTTSIALSQDSARSKAEAIDISIPHWAADNSVVRIALVTLTEAIC